MIDDILHDDNSSPGRLILPLLVLSRSMTAIPPLITGLLLIEIGESFGVPVGIAGQINAASSFLSVVFAFLVGALSVRFKHKSLLMIGLMIYCISSLGCYLSPNFNSMLALFSLAGIGFALVTPMVTALIGAHLPLYKRGGAIGWTIAGLSIIYLFGTLLTNLIAGLKGWRWAFLCFALPVSLISLLLVMRYMPKSSGRQSLLNGGNIIGGFKEVLSNKSALACIAGTSLSVANFNFLIIYGASFWRQRFLVSRSFVSISIIGTSLGYAMGSLACGRLVNKHGRKRLTVISTLLVGVFTVATANAPDIWSSLAFGMATSFFAGLTITAILSLTLEQVPRFRGTMMSLSSAATSIGQTIGASLGGILLLLFNYGLLGTALGALGLAAGVFFQVLATDPTSIDRMHG